MSNIGQAFIIHTRYKNAYVGRNDPPFLYTPLSPQVIYRHAKFTEIYNYIFIFTVENPKHFLYYRKWSPTYYYLNKFRLSNQQKCIY